MYLCMLECKLLLNFMALAQAQIKEFQSREQAVLLSSGFGLYFSGIIFLVFFIHFPWLQISGMDYDWKNRLRDVIAGSLTRDKETVGSAIHLETNKHMS